MEQNDILVRCTLSDTAEITSTGEEIGRGSYGRVFKVNYYGTYLNGPRNGQKQPTGIYVNVVNAVFCAIQTLYNSWDYTIHRPLPSLAVVQSFQL